MLFSLHLGCGHCQNAKPKFLKASEAFTAEPDKAFTAVDCTQDTGKYVIKFKCKIIQELSAYGKIPKINPGAYFSKALFEVLIFRGVQLYSEELFFGGKFAFQNRLG